MKIMWCGTASLLLESGGTRLLFDPYLRTLDKKGAPFPMQAADVADAVLITHPHIDHFGDIAAFAGKPVYVSARGIEIAAKNHIDTSHMHRIDVGETLCLGDLSVTVHRGRHCTFDLPTVLGCLLSPRLWVHFVSAMRLVHSARKFSIPKEDVFIFSVTDGKKTAVILGSAGRAERRNYPAGVSLLVFPYQGMARMHKKILPFLDLFRPQKVMIDHFDDAFPPVSRAVDPSKFPEAVKACFPEAETIVPQMNVWYEV